ncbi:GDSL-type esterase/lipase family protein (plasmid) [Deinococcus sp. KNUC1210]|uniref:SGNH/GDSL hydrolase family protein n=1 Tax=Deinococcus sp. KNUC1210 TaxID=2917691 RepID=UPI001EF1416F|nr:SGNH/GDSL hydrolase family protein [Deinococcus sp. KNUC1210]ULH17120.1 GDSL-type esterase/lipase family protein [Deinococcus sp. KNUC1210]
MRGLTARLLLSAVLLAATGTAAPATPSGSSAPPPVMRYVSLGDSLTAGFQSGGLTAQGQQAAYPVVVARLAHIDFGVPAGKAPGCPPPLDGGLFKPGASCVRVQPDVRGSNFAVPGARVEDLLNRTAQTAPDAATRQLYTLILGPKLSQVGAALKSRPTFISVWIGANNVLDTLTSGNPAQATPPAAFEASYRQLLDGLKPAGATVVLFTVPDVTRVPLLARGDFLFSQGFGQPDCKGSAARVALSVLLSQAPANCDAPYALTPAKLDAIRGTVNAYNAIILRLASERGLKVFDVNPLFATLKAADPNLSDPNQPFGPDFSLDGVHLSSAAQTRLADALVAFGNANFGLQIKLPGNS